jgi:hypothetical protein
MRPAAVCPGAQLLSREAAVWPKFSGASRMGDHTLWNTLLPRRVRFDDKLRVGAITQHSLVLAPPRIRRVPIRAAAIPNPSNDTMQRSLGSPTREDRLGGRHGGFVTQAQKRMLPA